MSSSIPGTAQYVLDLCARIAAHTDVPGTITRTFLSPATHAVHELLRAEMQARGMEVRVDAAGNLRGLYAGLMPDAPILLLGSHIDTVPDAGAYDGILGVALPLALLHTLAGRRLVFAIEVIAFSEEEGIRFKLPFIGSRALIGDLGPAELARTDDEGVTLAQAICDFGLDPEDLARAVFTLRTFAFLEVHIEQGPVLELNKMALGVVEAIAGQSRFEYTFSGQANHAGTTPMGLRKDALMAAAHWMLNVEQYPSVLSDADLRTTVGTIQAYPGAANIIPGKVVLSLDVRHPRDEVRELAGCELFHEATSITSHRGVDVRSMETSSQASTRMDKRLVEALAASSQTMQHSAFSMVSGAGHDAMILARKIPSAMLFVRSPGGLSHHPAESVLLEDVQAALDTCINFLNALQPADFDTQASLNA